MARDGMAKGKGQGRPRLEMRVHTFHLTLSLREGEDDDVIAFFARQPARGRARALKAALRRSANKQQAALAGGDNQKPKAEPGQGDETG
jgi:hypothetical protein